jgi:hypothetical protein
VSKSEEKFNPQNLVVNILGEKIYLKNMSSQMIDAIRELGAFQKEIAGEQVWLINCIDDEELTKKLHELNRMGFLFVGESAGWPPAEVFDYFRKKKLLSGKFKEVQWRGPGDWFIIER